MLLLQFLRKESTQSWKTILALTVVAGIANGALLALINAGASAAASDAASFRLLLLFMLAMGIYMLTKTYSLGRSMIVVEGMVKTMRLRICDKLRRAELPFVENLGRGLLYTTISQDANAISETAFVLTNAGQEAIMLVFALLYIGYLSKLALIITVAAVTFALVFYQTHRRDFGLDLKRLTKRDSEFLDSLNHIVNGFKECKLNRARNDALFDSFSAVADAATGLKINMGNKIVTDIMFSHVFFYLLIGVIVFILPRMVPTFGDVVLKMTAAVLFIIAPLELMVGAAPMLARSESALTNLYGLENSLDDHLKTSASNLPVIPGLFGKFQAITLDAALYHYNGCEREASFVLGPIDLTLRRGEMVFLVGGNGSGKSTLLKVLTGLYPLNSGLMTVDRQRLVAGNLNTYRSLFSAVFADFHLFDRLYGLEGIDPAAVTRLIAEMELTTKTGYADGRFSHLNLSTGQRKRLALIVALLEDRDIYVFDEWAADQDVQFRETFYRSILRGLQARGKTLIVATHDDRYWNLADRILYMEMGRLSPEPPPRSALPATAGA